MYKKFEINQTKIKAEKNVINYKSKSGLPLALHFFNTYPFTLKSFSNSNGSFFTWRRIYFGAASC